MEPIATTPPTSTEPLLSASDDRGRPRLFLRNSTAITHAPAIRQTPTMGVWGTEPLSHYPSAPAELISESMWHASQEGNSLNDWIRVSPDEVITTLREHAVKRLGSFLVPDTHILRAFGNRVMLTNGLDIAKDGSYIENWTGLLSSRSTYSRCQRLLQQGVRWENVQVTAYVVNIADSAAPQEKGMLNLLLKKNQVGAAPDDVWSYDAVKAVIEYKWYHWARRFFLIEFVLYLGWVIFFTVYIVIYIHCHLEHDFTDINDRNKAAHIGAYFSDVMTLLFMMPFLVIEYNSISHYGRRWFNMWNLLDSAAYSLQIFVSYCHLVRVLLNTKLYHAVLAIHCINLFVKVQYFARLFSQGSSFIELFVRVVKKVRFFFYFIALTIFSVAMAMTVLYMQDRERDPGSISAQDFGHVQRSLVTVYAVLVGHFDSSYVFETTNRVIKGIVFILFQVVMMITVVNLLVAMMTETYASIMADESKTRAMAKAQAMDELEITLPRRFHPQLKPYCHFLVVSNAAETTTTQPTVCIEEETSHELPGEGLKEEVEELKSDVKELRKMVQWLIQNEPTSSS